MKILYVSRSYIPSTKANSVHVMKMCSAFASLGHTVTLTGLESLESKDLRLSHNEVLEFFNCAHHFKVARFKSRGFFGFGKLLRRSYPFRSMIYSILYKPDLLYTRDQTSAFFCSFVNRTVIFELHGLTFLRSWLSKKIFELLVKRNTVKRIVVISEALKNELLKVYPLLSYRDVLVAHDGSSDETIKSDSDSEVHLGKDGVPKLIYVGSLHEGRGYDLIEALANKLSEFEFHIVGTGNLEKRLQERNDLPANLFFHGYKPYFKTIAFRNAADILLAPYEKKVFLSGGEDTSSWMSPLKIFEYMSSAKPIICSDLPVIREVLRDNENALLVEPDNVDAWASAVYKILKDKEFADRVSKNARLDFVNYYTWEQRASNVISFQSVMNDQVSINAFL